MKEEEILKWLLNHHCVGLTEQESTILADYLIKNGIRVKPYDRLAAYESTGLTPEEIKALQEDNVRSHLLETSNNMTSQSKPLLPCKMCFNARVDNSGKLDNNNDLTYISVVSADKDHRIMFQSGNGRPLSIIFESINKERNEMEIVGKYQPKFCPNCGRPLTEYKV